MQVLGGVIGFGNRVWIVGYRYRVARGHVSKRPSTGRWQFVVDGDRDASTGKRRQITRGGFERKADAELALAEFLIVQAQGNPLDDVVLTSEWRLDAWLERWINRRELSGELKPTTIAGYRRAIDRINRLLGDVLVVSLTAQAIESAWLKMLGGDCARTPSQRLYSKKTIAETRNVLKMALDVAERDGIIVSNPARLAKAPRRRSSEKAKIATWTADELAHFLSAVEGDPIECSIRLLAVTGMRRGEILGLGVADIDTTARVLDVRRNLTTVNNELHFYEPKSESSCRRLAIDQTTCRLIDQHLEAQDELRTRAGSLWNNDLGLMFTEADGSPIHPDRYTTRFKAWIRKTGLPDIRGPHGLRHTWATLALAAGIPAKVVQLRLGHASIQITLDMYTHRVDELDIKASNSVADALDSLMIGSGGLQK